MQNIVDLQIIKFFILRKFYKYQIGSMDKVGYISYHNAGNRLQLDSVLKSKENSHFCIFLIKFSLFSGYIY